MILALATSATACSSLTQPQEITIAAEPLPSPNAPPGAAAPAPEGPNLAGPAPGAPAQGG